MFDDAQGQQEFTIRLTEILKTKSEEYNQCAGRMDKLITKLNGDRAKRVASRQSQNASVAPGAPLLSHDRGQNSIGP